MEIHLNGTNTFVNWLIFELDKLPVPGWLANVSPQMQAIFETVGTTFGKLFEYIFKFWNKYQ